MSFAHDIADQIYSALTDMDGWPGTDDYDISEPRAWTNARTGSEDDWFTITIKHRDGGEKAEVVIKKKGPFMVKRRRG